MGCAGRYDIEVNQNADCILQVTFKDANGTAINIGGYTFKAEIRKGYGGEIVDEFTCAVMSPSEGKIQMSLTAVQTSKFLYTSYYYDLIATVTNVTTRFMEGFVEVSLGVTQNEASEES